MGERERRILQAREARARLEAEQRRKEEEAKRRGKRVGTIINYEVVRQGVLDNIERRYTEPELTLDDCMVEGYSRRNTQRALQPEGFRAFLARKRMAVAAELLRDGIPVGEVSRRVGYKQRSQFAKAFTRAHRILPHKYRRYYNPPWRQSS
jgi:AraC-like DNA-binding protein